MYVKISDRSRRISLFMYAFFVVFYFCWVAILRLSARCRRILARLPQLSILHHTRLPFLLVSRKSQPQSTAGHCLTRLASEEVKRSTAERITGQSGKSRASSRSCSIQFQAKPSSVGIKQA